VQDIVGRHSETGGRALDPRRATAEVDVAKSVERQDVELRRPLPRLERRTTNAILIAVS
jgi:hypothetical protein